MEKPVQKEVPGQKEAPAQKEVPESLFGSLLRRILYLVSDPKLPRKVIITLLIIELVVFINCGSIFFLVASLIINIASFLFCRYFVKKKRNDVLINEREMFSQYFLEVNPGFERAKWEELSLKMNIEFHEKWHWKSRTFFSNGDECRKSFKTYILTSFSAANSPTCYEAIKHYRKTCRELYEHLHYEEFPSNPRYLPINGKYGRFTLLLSNKDLLRNTAFKLFSLVPFFPYNSWYLESALFRHFLIIRAIFTLRSIPQAYESHIQDKYKLLGITQKIKFLATISHFVPGKDLQKWDEIASHMNWYLHADGTWTEEYQKFLDGEECRRFYESRMMPLSSENDTSYSDLRDIVSETNKFCAPL